MVTFEENEQFLDQVEAEMEIIATQQALLDQDDPEEHQTTSELVNSLKVVNELWATRLRQLNQRAREEEEKIIVRFLLLRTPQEKRMF